MFVYSHPPPGILDADDAAGAVTGDGYSMGGHAVDAGSDLDGDGVRDLLYTGLYVVYGPIEGSMDLVDADAVIHGGLLAGQQIASGFDANDDGYDDVLVGSVRADDYRGAAYVVYGPVAGEHSLTEADVTLVGAADSDVAGSSVGLAGDIDGDGHDDLLVAAAGADIWPGTHGAVYVLYGPVAGTIELATVGARLVAESSSSAIDQVEGVGDLNGDGLAEIAIHDRATGRVYIFYGRAR